MKEINLLLQTIIFTIIILLIDIPWISIIMSKLYKNVFQVKINFFAVILAYLCMIITYPLIIVKNNTLKDKLLTSSILGLVIYGTYGFTLAGIYDKYPLHYALYETLWGICLFSTTTYLTHFLVKSL
tara:strand:- start:2112 stop:2492 length:381 start_codon:yes stop_codon:yes gene_type:complete